MNFQQSKKIFKNWNQFNKQLLKEISEPELAQIDKAVEKAVNNPQDLPFNDLFGGKLRKTEKIAYDPYFDEGPLGVLVRQISLAGWKLDLNTGIASKDVKTEFEGVERTQTRKMKVNAIWTKLLALVEKYDKLTTDAYDRYQGDSWSPEKMAEYSDFISSDPEILKTMDQTKELVGQNVAFEYMLSMSYKVAKKRIEEMMKTWQTDAPKLKGMLEKGSGQSVVFSRHPVDVIRMSDFKSIKSCHTPGETYYRCAVAEAYDGGVVAYLVNDEDLKKISDYDEQDIDKSEIFEDPQRGIRGIQPVGRVRLRYLRDTKTDVDLALPENRYYGKRTKGFENLVNSWAAKNQGEKIDKILATTENKELDLDRFERFGGEYEDTSAYYLFHNLRLQKLLPKSFDNFHIKGDPIYASQIQKRITSRGVVENDTLRARIENLKQSFNNDMRLGGYDIFLQQARISDYVELEVYYIYKFEELKLQMSESELQGMWPKMRKWVNDEIMDYFPYDAMETKFGINYIASPELEQDGIYFNIVTNVIEIEGVNSTYENCYEELKRIYDGFYEKGLAAAMNQIIGNFLTREGVYRGGSLTKLNDDIIDGNIETEWQLKGDNDHYARLPDMVYGTLDVPILISNINNPGVLYAVRNFPNLTDKLKEFVFGKSLTSSTLSKDLNTFITIGNDFVNIRLTFGLRYTTPDNLVDQMRQKIITKDELFNEPKVDYVQGLTDIINDVVRLRGVPPEQTKLQEFKHVSKNWKNFIS
jgi:hypothetical protein